MDNNISTDVKIYIMYYCYTITVIAFFLTNNYFKYYCTIIILCTMYAMSDCLNESYCNTAVRYNDLYFIVIAMTEIL